MTWIYYHLDADIYVDAIETFILVLKKRQFFCVLFSKIEGSPQKDHILKLNMRINLCNHYCNLELIDFKASDAPKHISIPFSNLR